ncbi:MAG: MMPL family transporter [Planctomycetaceae bacterium]|nr:MMPL family transporter [Planctomycetaceae bacterium]
MFLRLGQWIARRWLAILLMWGGALATAAYLAPPLESVVRTGEFAFLPEDSPSRAAERLFAQSFPNRAQASTIAIIARREGQPLTPADLDFVDDGSSDADANSADAADSDKPPASSAAPNLIRRLHDLASQFDLISRPAAADAASEAIPIVTHRDRNVGKMLVSGDEHATIVLVELPTEFLDSANAPLVRKIEELLFEDAEFRRQIPGGLELYLSGTAVVGRDMLKAARDSAKATEHLTIILVIALLIAIYRAPMLALVPLLTVFVSVKLTMLLLCWMASQGWVVLFTGIESYVTVLLYGAGVDYCLFLIARFKEEIDRGIPAEQALVDAVGSVGAAIAASAGTVICGIGMMIFAEFGKFRDAGIAISFGLVIVLIAALTLTPALMRSAGLAIFWPRHQVRLEGEGPESSGWLQSMWDGVSHLLLRRSWWLWLGSLALMLPFAAVGAYFFSDLSYGLLSDLPRTARSVVGTEVVRHHFADGLTGPTTVLIEAPDLNFLETGDEHAGIDVIERLTQALAAKKEELGLADIRSVAYPLGGDSGLSDIRGPAVYKLTLQRSLENYVAHTEGEAPARVTRLELVTTDDPFSRDSIRLLTELEADLQRAWRDVTAAAGTFFVLGPTASIRDLKSVTDRDQVRIDLLATIGVFLILVILLRRTAICVYLIVSVLLSYLATLGVTYLAFWWLDGAAFAGLDWKVPMFLFTILIAVGEDYNIFLMSRVAEEQARRGRVEGIIHALSCTGRIISSCGIIMAGTFASLAAGSLKGMAQLGFALAVGVLLDTFVVRPILVPAYLVLVETGAFGPLSKWLGRLPDSEA